MAFMPVEVLPIGSFLYCTMRYPVYVTASGRLTRHQLVYVSLREIWLVMPSIAHRTHLADLTYVHVQMGSRQSATNTAQQIPDTVAGITPKPRRMPVWFVAHGGGNHPVTQTSMHNSMGYDISYGETEEKD